MMKDIHSASSLAVALAAAVLDSTTAGASVDLKGYDGCEFNLSVGVGGITFTGTNKIEFVMEESDNDSDWSAVAAAHILGASSVTNGIVKALTSAHAAAAAYRFGYVGYKRYVRLRAVFGGTHGTGTPIAATATLRGMNNPQPDQA